MWQLIAAFYDNTTGAVMIGDYVDPEAYNVHNGVKEGSLLSPLLFAAEDVLRADLEVALAAWVRAGGTRSEEDANDF